MPQYEDGQEILGAVGWCSFCDILFGGSATPRRAIALNGKLYHPECYPRAVDIHLANLKLQEANRGKP
jgi:hypothetical protein